MKKAMLILGTGIAMFTMACNETTTSNKERQDSIDKQVEKKEDMNEKVTDDKTASFVVDAAEAGMAEVKMGELAVKKASNKKVKEFGAMMVKDHTQANDELKALAAKKGWALPTALVEEHQKHLDELGKKTGAEFDKEYVDMMVDGHDKVIKMFENAGEDSKDVDLKAWIGKTLPTLHKHSEEIKAIKETQKKM